MIRACDQCGQSYEAIRSTSRFCGSTCRQRALRAGRPAVRTVRRKACIVCGAPFEAVGRGGTARYCSGECRQEQERRRQRARDAMGKAPCAGGCARGVWVRGNGGLPAGEAMCRTCRRRRREEQAEAWRRELAERRDARRAAAEVRRRERPSSTARGYGEEHRRRRAALLPAAIGTDCELCGDVMLDGQPLDLDHSVPLREDPASVADRVVHSVCNRAWRSSGVPRRRPCEVCGEEYVAKSPRQRACSRACGVEVRRRNQSEVAAA